MSGDFYSFARNNGLMIRELISDGRVHRCPTVTHPRKRNGAYAWDGRSGFVQDWATHADAIAFRNRDQEVTSVPVRPPVDMAPTRRRAAELARTIVARCAYQPHPYLARKGFPAEMGLVDIDGRLVVPMRDANEYSALLSVQHIAEDGGKRFLAGGAAKNAIYVIGIGDPVLVEGYATALSVRAAMAKLYRQVKVVVCFSAGNLTAVAKRFRGAVIVADNDRSGTGWAAAQKAGLKAWMPADVGEDFNDFHLRVGLDKAAQALRHGLGGVC